jgi:hypothetical protein
MTSTQASLSDTITSISNCLQLSKPAAERRETARREFALEVGRYPAEYLVTADEAAVNILTTYRNNGWSYKGLRAIKSCNFVRGTRCGHLLTVA